MKTRRVFSETVRRRVTRKRADSADSRVWNVWKMAQRGKSVDAEAECMLPTTARTRHGETSEQLCSSCPCAKALQGSGWRDAPHAVEDDGVALLHEQFHPLRRVDARPHFVRQHGPVMRPTQLLELGLAERRDDGSRELRTARHDHERGVAGVDGVQVRDGVVEALPRGGGVVLREERHVLLPQQVGSGLVVPR